MRFSQPQSTVFVSEIWNAWNVTPTDNLPDWPIALHTDVPTTFLIYTNGKTFGGKAIIDNCPGFGDLKDGKIDGENISLNVVAHFDNGQDITIYYSGKIHGDEMDLMMRWPAPEGRTLQLNMKAKKSKRD